MAVGKVNGGYDSIVDATNVMGKVLDKTYNPILQNVETYEKLYSEYKGLHDYFGRGENDIMKRLNR